MPLCRPAVFCNRRALALLFAALLSFGCVTEVAVVLPGVAVIAPMNFDGAVPDQFAAGVKPTTTLLTKYIEHRGIRVIRPTRDEVRAAFLEVLAGEKSPSNDSPAYADLMVQVLEKFQPGNEDAVLIIPRLVHREAQLNGRRGRWDGAVRTVIVEVPPQFADDYEGRFGATTAGAVSLRLGVYGPTGLIQDSYGGVDFTWKFATGANRTQRRVVFSYVDRDGEDIFKDPAVVARSVRVALDPFIPRR